MIGARYDRLTVVDAVDKTRSGKRVLCRCECGHSKIVYVHHLKQGKVKSCGCLNSELVTARNRTHGQFGTPTHRTWSNMLTRCCNPKASQWDYYGGRGVSVCDRWRKFENFVADMGERPAGLTIDRIDPYGNYEPGNCRWATRSEQARNTRHHRDTVRCEVDSEI